MKEIVLAAGLGTVLISIVLALYRWGQRRAVSMVQRWAEKNRFELLHFRERALFESAPFSFLGSNRTPHYFVRVRDQQGRERHGWIRLGTGLVGIFGAGKDKVEAKWDEDAQ